MTHLKIEQNNTGIEEVSHSIIKKLYNIAISGTLDANSNLKGRLHVPVTYRSYVTYLTQNNPELYIASDNYYMPFADDDLKNILATYIGDGTNVLESDVTSFTGAFGAQRLNTNLGTLQQFASTSLEKESVDSFDEFLYFTGVTSVNLSAFNGFSNLTSIVLPSSVTTIGLSAFDGCSSLLNINLDNVTYIGRAGLKDCSSLQSVNAQNVTSTQLLMFDGCSSLETISLSNGQLTELPNVTFNRCTNLETVSGLNNVTTVGYSAFYNTGSLTLCDIDFEKLTSVSLYAFSATGLKINGNMLELTTIGSYAFTDCKFSGTKELKLPKITSISGYAFKNTDITSVLLGNNITEIPSYSFLNCTSLSSINLGNIHIFGNSAFNNCTSLTEIDLSSATYTDYSSPFVGCTNLQTVTIGGDLQGDAKSDIFNTYNSSNITTFNLVNPQDWTKLDLRTMPYFMSRCHFDILSFPNVNYLFDGECGMLSKGDGGPWLKLMYVPKVTSAVTTWSNLYKRTRPFFGSSAQMYINDGARKRINLLYFKDLSTLPANSFGGLLCNALVINNTTPPTYNKEYYEKYDEYRGAALDVYVDTWGNAENATDSTAAIQYTGYNFYSNGTICTVPSIDYIYVPDSAVNTYKTTPGWDLVSTKIKGISELNNNVKYATKADWIAAGKPVALIEEYM